MDFELNEEQQMMQRMVRDFAEKEIRPIAQAMDEKGEFPWEVIHKMGGLEEVSRVSGSVGITLAAHTSLGLDLIYRFGSDKQKSKYLPALAAGEGLAAFGLTEPEAGSDAGAVKTTAVLDGNDWVINGQKVFITSGSIADVVIVAAVTDKSAGTRGISNFIVQEGTSGFRPGRDEDKMGLKGSVTSQLFFEDCHVPKENLLGQLGEGYRQFLITLDGGRISIGAMALGLAQGAFEAAVEYSRQRVQFGQPIAKFQAIQWMIADMATEIEAARWMVYRAAWSKDQGVRFTKEAAMAKLYASEAAERACFNSS